MKDDKSFEYHWMHANCHDSERVSPAFLYVHIDNPEITDLKCHLSPSMIESDRY